MTLLGFVMSTLQREVALKKFCVKLRLTKTEDVFVLLKST